MFQRNKEEPDVFQLLRKLVSGYGEADVVSVLEDFLKRVTISDAIGEFEMTGAMESGQWMLICSSFCYPYHFLCICRYTLE